MANTSEDRPEQAGPKVTPGTPVYDVAGDVVGHVSEYGFQWPHLIVRKGHILHREVYVPVGAIARADATGVHLSLTRKQVHDLDDGWSALGDVDLDTGTPAGAQVGDAEFPDGNNIAGTTTDTSGQPGMPMRDTTGHT